jgi:hypothetical protein
MPRLRIFYTKIENLNFKRFSILTITANQLKKPHQQPSRKPNKIMKNIKLRYDETKQLRDDFFTKSLIIKKKIEICYNKNNFFIRKL